MSWGAVRRGALARAVRSGRGQGGSALLAVLVISLLVSAAGVGSWVMVQLEQRAAQRRILLAKTEHFALSAAALSAQWFEERERGAVVAAPDGASVARDGRRVDPEGDGAGTPWGLASPPWNVRYKEDGGELFRPPDGPGAEDRFLGTAIGPDVLLEGDGGVGESVLDALEQAIDRDPHPAIDLSSVAFFRPPPWAGGDALATVEVVAICTPMKSAPVRVTARALVRRVDWGRLDRPLVVAGDASLSGEARWERGEAVVAGDLDAGDATLVGWPAGVPWSGPDRPLRWDNDGDGTADDRDGDGTADFEQWRRLGDPVPDPWWRARIAGEWFGRSGGLGSCETPFPFGPWRTTPAPPSKVDDRSGLLVHCPLAGPVEAVDSRWRRLGRRGVRGVRRYREEPGEPGLFRLDGVGEGRALDEILPRRGGVVMLETDPASPALDLGAESMEGAVVVTGARPLSLSGGTASPLELTSPAALRDTAGADRPAGPEDEFLDQPAASLDCSAWQSDDWLPAGSTETGTPAACGELGLHFHGLLASDGPVRIEGPWNQEGSLRAGTLNALGDFGAIRLIAPGSSLAGTTPRPGPPGTPRVVLTDPRLVH